mmetsp:Transcript_39106/g.60925  ORF Transcript_39106/g.60925 Transcript_39106/m.60925 type:complete len:265 (-) Transcript_39106:510-1304(-)
MPNPWDFLFACGEHVKKKPGQDYPDFSLEAMNCTEGRPGAESAARISRGETRSGFGSLLVPEDLTLEEAIRVAEQSGRQVRILTGEHTLKKTISISGKVIIRGDRGCMVRGTIEFGKESEGSVSGVDFAPSDENQHVLIVSGGNWVLNSCRIFNSCGLSSVEIPLIVSGTASLKLKSCLLGDPCTCAVSRGSVNAFRDRALFVNSFANVQVVSSHFMGLEIGVEVRGSSRVPMPNITSTLRLKNNNSMIPGTPSDGFQEVLVPG